MEKKVEAPVEQFKRLLALIEATYTLLTEGHFGGKHAKTLAAVQQWLESYHKDVKHQIPVDLTPTAKLEAKNEAVEAEVVKP